MNEQKDKLLINLVEPGRIGRCPFNSFFSFQLALPNGRADEKNRIDGPCGISGIDWFAFVWFLGGLWAAGRQWLRPRKANTKSKSIQGLLSSLFSIWFISSLMNWSNWEKRRRLSWMRWMGCLVLWGVMGGAPANAPQRESKQQHHPSIPIQQKQSKRAKWKPIQPLIQLLMEWKKRMKSMIEWAGWLVEWSGSPSSSTARQAHQLSLSFVGPLRAIKKREKSWMRRVVLLLSLILFFSSFSLFHSINKLMNEWKEMKR